jgi:hypothetical protein
LAGDNRIAIAVPGLKADVPAAIESLQMGFFPVPGLSLKDRQPLTLSGERHCGWTC